MITAPYNFVPLNTEVVHAYWAQQISHDLPVSDFESGSVDLEITAKSPIFVRNGGKEGEPDTVFNNFNGKYFIPGSSIKGMVRNVLEIMSFGNMGNKVNDVKLSVRDFHNNTIYPIAQISAQAQVAWLRKDGDTMILKPCGEPGRITHKELDKLCSGCKEGKMSEYYQNSDNIASDEDKSAKKKYDKFIFKKEGHTFSKDSEVKVGKVYKLDPSGGESGTIVFTGQPGYRNKATRKGKHYEFIFFDKDSEEIRIEKGSDEYQVIKNFLYAYYDHDKNQQSWDWKVRKAELEQGKSIPIFFRLKKGSKMISAENIKDIGLSLLYKIGYEYSIKESIERSQHYPTGKIDLSEAIFGYVSKEEKESLKGRVWISHAFAVGNPNSLDERNEVLAGPKATYYPNYIKQDRIGKGNGEYMTFMDKEAEIRGYKRYPVRPNGKTMANPAPISKKTKIANPKISTKFCPLEAGTKFRFSISYHNLKKVELGALLSALTFHAQEQCHHSLGMGKPLGYGVVDLKILNMEAEKVQESLKAYEAFMNWSLKKIEPSWHESEQLQELFAMARPSGIGEEKWNYMELESFPEAKKGKDYLRKFSDISENKKPIHSLLSTPEYNGFRDEFDRDRKLMEDKALTFDIGNWKNSVISEKREEIAAKIEEKKNELKELINQKKSTYAKEKEQDEIEARRNERSSSGLDLSDLKISSRAFDGMSKKVNNYLKDLRKVSGDPHQLINRDSDVNHLSQKIIEIHAVLPKRELAEWDSLPYSKNSYHRKISNWVGEEKASEIFESIKSS